MLNPSLPLDAYARAFAQTGAIAMPSVLRPDIADQIGAAVRALDWVLEICDYTQTNKFAQPLGKDAGSRDLLAVLDRVEHKIDPDNLFYVRLVSRLPPSGILRDFEQFLRSDDFLKTMHEVTGRRQVTHLSEIEANCYSKGCFLGMHRDDHHPENKVAFVFNFTRNWRLDWGGFLTLQNMILPPQWNALSLFAVPADHFVSCISPAATEKRYSLTGWLRSA